MRTALREAKLLTLCFGLFVAAMLFTSLALGSGSVKEYQNRTLINTLKAERPDLSDAQIKRLVDLPRVPQIAYYDGEIGSKSRSGRPHRASMVGVWLYVSPDGTKIVRFDGAKGEVIVYKETSKY